MEIDEYVVYDVYYCGYLAYVGSGDRQRPLHVKSGKSHNKSLNEISLRSEMFGEPEVEVKIFKTFKNRKDATDFEAKRIRHKATLFNASHCGLDRVRILTNEEHKQLANLNIKLQEALQRLETLSRLVKVSPLLIFTPFGFRVPVTELRPNVENYDAVALTLFGSCKPYDDICNIEVNHSGEATLKVREGVVDTINNLFGKQMFTDFVNYKRTKTEAKVFRDNHVISEMCSVPPQESYEYMDKSVVLARRLCTYMNIDIVLCLKMTEDSRYSVLCLNNQKEYFLTDYSSEALEVYRNAVMNNYELYFYNDSETVIIPFTLNGCIDFKSGKVYTKPSKSVLVPFKNCLFKVDEALKSKIRSISDENQVFKNKTAKYFYITAKGEYGTTNVKLSSFKEVKDLNSFWSDNLKVLEDVFKNGKLI